MPLLFEPLNRYETNLVNTVADGAWLRAKAGAENVKLLVDLFHMNIEEADVPSAIRAGAGAIGHVHFVDSNRRPAGCGHTDFSPIAAAFRDIGYDGYVSAEASVPRPGASGFADDSSVPPVLRRQVKEGRCSQHQPIHPALTKSSAGPATTR